MHHNIIDILSPEYISGPADHLVEPNYKGKFLAYSASGREMVDAKKGITIVLKPITIHVGKWQTSWRSGIPERISTIFQSFFLHIFFTCKQSKIKELINLPKIPEKGHLIVGPGFSADEMTLLETKIWYRRIITARDWMPRRSILSCPEGDYAGVFRCRSEGKEYLEMILVAPPSNYVRYLIA